MKLKQKFKKTGAGIIVPKRVTQEIKVSPTMSLKLFRDLSTLKKAPLLLGFPSIGVTPILISNFIVEQTDLPLIGFFSSPNFPQSTIISQSQPSPSVRIFGDERIVIVMSESKIPEISSNDVVSAILMLSEILSFPMIYCVEGIPNQVIDDRKRSIMEYITTSPSTHQRLQEMQHKALSEAVIAGLTGGVLARASIVEQNQEEPHQVTCLLVNSSSLYPDVTSALMAVRVIHLLMGGSWEIDLSPLEESASKMENKVKDILAEATPSNDYKMLYG